VLAGKGRVEESQALINSVKAADPENTGVLYPIGALNLRQRRCGPAADALVKFVEANPKHDRALTLLGFAYECLGQKDLAVETFERALDAAPNAATAEVVRRRLDQLK
jgi:Flp pilus assembly protein TadD